MQKYPGPRVSVIIPCYNRERFIGEAIASAISQSYSNREVVVVDDGSSDASWSVITSFGKNVVAIRTKNGGVSAARNKGLAAASGEYVVFLDSDDRLEPYALNAYAQAISLGIADQAKLKAILMGNNGSIDENGRSYPSRLHCMYNIPKDGLLLPLPDIKIISGWSLTVGYLIPRALIDAIHGFDETLSLAEDYDLNVRMLDAGGVFLPIGTQTYQVRTHVGSKLTTSISQQRYEELYQLLRRVWISFRVAFLRPENSYFRTEFARLIWSRGRDCYRARLRDTGDRFICLAFEVGGVQARNGSPLVTLTYNLISPYFVERFVDLVKAPKRILKF